jgi:hypothetical protein
MIRIKTKNVKEKERPTVWEKDGRSKTALCCLLAQAPESHSCIFDFPRSSHFFIVFIPSTESWS